MLVAHHDGSVIKIVRVECLKSEWTDLIWSYKKWKKCTCKVANTLHPLSYLCIGVQHLIMRAHCGPLDSESHQNIVCASLTALYTTARAFSMNVQFRLAILIFFTDFLTILNGWLGSRNRGEEFNFLRRCLQIWDRGRDFLDYIGPQDGSHGLWLK